MTDASAPGICWDTAEWQQMDLRGNPLTHLPPSIVALPRLEKLDLRRVDTLAAPEWIISLEERGCAVYR